MASFNRVVLVGNLTRDPELRYIPSGTAVTEVGLAINDRRKGPNGDWIEETTFVEVTLWARQAEVASEYLTKGSSVLIEGRLKLDTWEKDGKKNSKLRVVGERMQMLGGKGGGSGGSRGGAARGSSGGAHGGDSSAGGSGGFDESEASFGGGSGGDSYDDAPASAPGGRGNRGGPAPADDIPF
jgi:single-strand DNA-binding protein